MKRFGLVIVVTLAILALSGQGTPAQDSKKRTARRRDAHADSLLPRVGPPAIPIQLQLPEIALEPSSPPVLEPPPAQPVLPPMASPPPQPSLAQPSGMQPTLARPAVNPPSSVRSYAAAEALAQPSAAAPTLAPHATIEGSLSQPRPIGPTEAPAGPAPAALALPPPQQQPPPPVPSGTQYAAQPAALRPSESPAQAAIPAINQPQPTVAQQPGSLTGRKFTFTQEPATSPYSDAPYAVRVTIRTNVPMQPASLAIACDEDILHGGYQVTSQHAAVKGLRDGRINNDRRVYWMTFQEPAFEPHRPIVVVLMSAQPIRVLSVNESSLK